MPSSSMGASPPSASSSHLHLARPSSLSASPPPNSLSDWFLSTSDLDTHILTQALSELSTPAPASASSSPPSSSLCQTLNFDTPESLHVLRALQQQQKQQHQKETQAAFMACGWPRQDRLHSSLHVGSPPSSNSHSPLSASNPGSPYSHSTITTTNSSMYMPTDRLLARMNPITSLQQDVQQGLSASTMNASPSDNSIMDSKSFHSSRAGSIALSSQASVGAGVNKVSKRRSRASNRSPIAVLSADVSNFRAMVQQLTGIPSTAPSMHSYGGNSSLLRSYPTKHTYTSTASLPTLDTSASFLGSKLATKDPLQGFSFAQRNHYSSAGPLTQGGNGGSMLRSDAPLYAKQSVFGEQPSVSSSSSSIWNEASYRKPSGNSKIQPFLSEPLEEHLATKSQYSGVDSWLSFDGVLANQTPNIEIEIARMA